MTGNDWVIFTSLLVAWSSAWSFMIGLEWNEINSLPGLMLSWLVVGLPAFFILAVIIFASIFKGLSTG